jgi:hypothetical protein
MLAADTTKIVLVGVSHYSVPALRLSFAAANAKDLAKALSLPDGCAIPDAHVTLLTDEAASKIGVLESLRKVATGCIEDDVLIFYFSGHGEQQDTSFYLFPWEVDTSDVRDSAISAGDLQAAIAGCKARGILFVLDCCKSAGFAENANTFFQTLGNREFRLLLSASRAGQQSYEFFQEGTIFTRAIEDVLNGRSVPGEMPGVVYFSDLFEYVRKRVAEGLESLGHLTTLQEPVFAGTYSKDPRLFILKKLSLERIESETPLYSRKYVRQRIRRVLQAIGVCVFFVLAAYYSYLDHSRYVWHETGVVDGLEGDYLAIYAGDARMNWLGFPHRIRTIDLRTDALPTDVRPGVGTPLKSTFSPDIETDLLNAMTPEYKVTAFVWQGDDQSALKYVEALDVYDPPVAPGTTEAVSALASIATPTNISRLEDNLLESSEVDSSSALLRKIAALDAARAIDILENEDTFGGAFDSPKQQRALLEGFPTRCDPSIAKYLIKMARHADDDSYMHDAWYGALLRTGCVLPTKTLSELLEHFPGQYKRQLDLLGYVGTHKPIGFGQILANHIKHIIEEMRSHPNDAGLNYRDSYKLWLDLRLLALVYPRSVPEETWRLLSSLWKCVRVAASRALLAKNHGNSAILLSQYAADPWILSTLIQNGWYDESVARQTMNRFAAENQKNGGMLSVLYFLRSLRLRHTTASRKLVQEIVDITPLAEVRLEATRTLSSFSANPDSAPRTPEPVALAPSPESDVAVQRLDGLNEYSVLEGTFWWYLRRDHRASRNALIHLADNIDDAANIFGRALLTDLDLERFRSLLDKGDSRLAAATILAMRGQSSDLTVLLQSPDYNLRNQAMLYAVYNPNLHKVLEGNWPQHFGLRTKAYLTEQTLLKRQLQDQIDQTPLGLRSAVLRVLASEFPNTSVGIRLWIEDEIDKLEGPTTDDLEEILIPINTPQPIRPPSISKELRPTTGASS